MDVSTLDNYVEKNKVDRLDFIKIDVEGSELMVFQGGIGTINRFRPVILCELADIRTHSLGYDSKLIYEFIEKAGYSWYAITEKHGLKKFAKKDRYNDNLLAIPDEKKERYSSMIG